MGFHSLIMVFESFEFPHQFLYFDKKIGISAYQAKFATISHFDEKLAHTMKYDQTMIEKNV